jgi:hypothetical protein
MLSHTVPRKLLEHFAFHDPVPNALRLWRYEKDRAPYGRATPKSATRWDGHFADPANAQREEEIEARLEREFENPVNTFIDELQDGGFAFTPERARLLTVYITMLFHRTRARRGASPLQHDRMLAALRALRADKDRIERLTVKHMTDFYIIGTPRVVTHAEIIAAIDRSIANQSTPDMPQRRYLDTMETMMGFVDDHMRDGEWHILSTTPDNPFVIGDAPVVTWERDDQRNLVYGQGFARPNVEVILPVFPTACLHILPSVQRTRPVVPPSVDDVNRTQAAFATEHCFTNIKSEHIHAVLQPVFGTIRLGIEAFTLHHLDAAAKLFDILMNQPPYEEPVKI